MTTQEKIKAIDRIIDNLSIISDFICPTADHIIGKKWKEEIPELYEMIMEVGEKLKFRGFFNVLFNTNHYQEHEPWELSGIDEVKYRADELKFLITELEKKI